MPDRSKARGQTKSSPSVQGREGRLSLFTQTSLEMVSRIKSTRGRETLEKPLS